MENVLKLLLDLPESYDGGISLIGKYCKDVVYLKGSKFFKRKERSDYFFVLLSGLVDIRYVNIFLPMFYSVVPSHTYCPFAI